MTAMTDTFRSADSEIEVRALHAWIVVLLVAWFSTVLLAGANGVFVASPSRPPLMLLVAIVGPLVAFGLAYRLSQRVRSYAWSIDLRWLTAIQAWRVLGAVFLALYAFDLLPGVFAWPAGLGDAAVGVSAPFVLLAMLRQSSNWARRVFWLNVAGLLDFTGAVGTGLLTSNSALGVFFESAHHASLGTLPLSLVPTFAVPLWIIFHTISLIQLRRIAARQPSKSAQRM